MTKLKTLAAALIATTLMTAAAPAALAVELSAVQAGMPVWVKLNANPEITLLDATTPSASTPTNQVQTVTGTVLSVILPEANVLGIVTVRPASGSTVTAAVAPAAPITISGASGSLAGVHAGDAVEVQLIAGIITQLKVTAPAAPAQQ